MAEQQVTEKKQDVPMFGTLYGRKWLIQIFKPAYKENENGEKERDTEHDISIDVSDLRCLFRVKYEWNTAVTIGTLVIYNLNATTEASIITEGFQVSIYGGYEQGQYGEIFTGDIIQVIRNRENGIDYKLEILAAACVAEFDWNFTKSSVAANSTPRERAKAVCETADTPIEIGEVSENISEQPLPRGKIFFGKPYKYLRDIAIANNGFFNVNGEKKVELHSILDEIPEDMCLELTPETGLVGTPKYTDNGINIKMLLDPRVKLKSLIKIDNDIIQRQLINIDSKMSQADPKKGDSQGKGQSGNGQVFQKSQFDESGEYMVIQVAHSGDTYGDDWTTEVIGLSRNGKSSLVSAMDDPQQNLQ